VVEAGEHDLDGVVEQFRLLEQRAQRRPRPLCGATASTSHG
jgi:hypothetical protein